MGNKKKDRFDLEDEIMRAWHITDDLGVIISATDSMEMPPKDRDRLLNMLIGLKALQHERMTEVFNLFEKLIHDRKIT
jgi:hypothetical protein